MELISQNRKSNVLTPSDLPCLRDVCSVNISSGCAHGCAYCYARSYSQAPAEGSVVFYVNTAEKLMAEWPRKRKTPRKVYFCPSSDLFQPVSEMLDVAYEMLDFILAQGARVAITTKGVVPERHLNLLVSHPDKVHVQAGLITHDDSVRKVLEPNTASVDVRIAQIKTLRAAGVAVKLRIAPVIPTITDDEQTLRKLCCISNECNISDVVINVLHLRPAILRSLEKKLPPDWIEKISGAYGNADNLKLGGRYAQDALSKEKRQRFFAWTKKLCAEYGLNAHICSCMNPDITNERCFLAGDERAMGKQKKQMELFE